MTLGVQHPFPEASLGFWCTGRARQSGLLIRGPPRDRMALQSPDRRTVPSISTPNALVRSVPIPTEPVFGVALSPRDPVRMFRENLTMHTRRVLESCVHEHGHRSESIDHGYD